MRAEISWNAAKSSTFICAFSQGSEEFQILCYQLKVVLLFAKFFAMKKLNCLIIIHKRLLLELPLNNSKLFRIKFLNCLMILKTFRFWIIVKQLSYFRAKNFADR